MNFPCIKCLICSMCRTACDDLVIYIKNNTEFEYDCDKHFTYIISSRILDALRKEYKLFITATQKEN
jgi:formylmethanofuran dehydrogenase subunit B